MLVCCCLRLACQACLPYSGPHGFWKAQQVIVLGMPHMRTAGGAASQYQFSPSIRLQPVLGPVAPEGHPPAVPARMSFGTRVTRKLACHAAQRPCTRPASAVPHAQRLSCRRLPNALLPCHQRVLHAIGDMVLGECHGQTGTHKALHCSKRAAVLVPTHVCAAPLKSSLYHW